MIKKEISIKLYFKKIVKYLILFLISLLILYNNIYLFSLNNSEFKTNIFKRKLYVINDKTMENYLKKGDIVIIKTNTKKYEIDDIVLLQDGTGLKLERIVDVIEDNNGDKTYISKSDKSFYLDHIDLKEDVIIGKSVKKIANLAWILNIARSKNTTILIILILLVTLFFLIQIRIYNPTRTRNSEGESLKQILKTIFSKKYREDKKRKDKHSRFAQKEKLNKKQNRKQNKIRIKNKKIKDNKEHINKNNNDKVNE